MKCKFEISWVGQCRKEAVDGELYCDNHLDEKCFICKEQATHDCETTMGAFVCGFPLCDKKECIEKHGH